MRLDRLSIVIDRECRLDAGLLKTEAQASCSREEVGRDQRVGRFLAPLLHQRWELARRLHRMGMGA